MQQFLHQFVNSLQQTSLLEFIAVVFGIASVLFSRKENILVYPVGLVNTIIYIYLSIKEQLFGEASVNLYYTFMSIYGWWLWSRRDHLQKPAIRITFSNSNDRIQQLIFFSVCYGVIWASLTLLKNYFDAATLPVADAFASAAAFTGMWLMARKKVESWYWWVITNIASIPLYYAKGYVFTSVYYNVLLIIAFSGLIEWRRVARRDSDAQRFNI